MKIIKTCVQIDPTYWKLMNMSTADLFVLSRMAQSLDKEVMTKVCHSR